MDYVLVHHGIKGQKWGVRNGPPYPLDNASTKEHNKNSSGEKKKHASANRKKAIAIGAAFVATALAAYGAYKLVDSGRLRALSTKGMGFLRGDDKFPFNCDLNLSQEMSAEDIWGKVVSKINPGYDETGWRGHNNCRRCTFAYEMRRRGFDVQATQTLSGTGQNEISLHKAQGDKRTIAGAVLNTFREAFSDVETLEKVNSNRNIIRDIFDSYWDSPNMHRIRIPDRDFEKRAPAIYEVLSKMPNGSRGELGFAWSNASNGHSCAWEIVNNHPVVFDCQTNSMYKSFADFIADFNPINIGEATITRLDDVDLDYGFISRWVKNI